MEAFLAMFIVAFWLLIWLGTAYACGQIAKSKRRQAGLWYVLGFLFGLFALLLIAVLPKEEA